MLDILDVSENENSLETAQASQLAGQLVSPTVIKVIGCGGCGGNAVNTMVASGIQGVTFIALNTDLQQLTVSKADIKLQIGKKITNGLGAGAHPEVGEAAAKEEEETIKKLLEGTNMIFITAGMGGGTGTGSAPVVARIARSLGILTVAVVTTPFKFEGTVHMNIALEGIKKLRDEVDSLIVIPNEKVLEESDKKLTTKQAFATIDDILRQGVKGISEIITKTGFINRDFEDVQTVMKGQGDAILGIGVGSGENRAVDAATNAINNRLLADTHIDGAKNILVKISANEDNCLASEPDEIINLITASADKDAHILWGLYYEPDMEDKIAVTVVATGFDSPNKKIEIEPDAAVPVAAQTSAPSGNVISTGVFEDILNPTKVLKSQNVEEPELTSQSVNYLQTGVSQSAANERIEAGSLTEGMKSRVNVERTSQPYNFAYAGTVNPEDLTQPTCIRNQLINLKKSQ